MIRLNMHDVTRITVKPATQNARPDGSRYWTQDIAVIGDADEIELTLYLKDGSAVIPPTKS